MIAPTGRRSNSGGRKAPMKLRISPSARSSAAATRRRPIDACARLQLRTDAEQVHLRQRAEDVLHRSVVNVEHHLL